MTRKRGKGENESSLLPPLLFPPPSRFAGLRRNFATHHHCCSSSRLSAGLLAKLSGEIFADFCYIKYMQEKNDNFPMIFLVCLSALILPLILIPVEKIAPYPHVVEEIAKAILIFTILKNSKPKSQLILILIMAFLFALSENIFYSTNFITGGILYSFWQRFLLTTGLHLLTAVIILLPSQKKLKLIVPATMIAIIVHYFYNQLVLLIF